MGRLLLIVLVVALGGCDRDDPGPLGGEPVDDEACALADGIFPGERLSDWKSYADHVALVHVASVGTGEHDLPVYRLDVKTTYWSADGAPSLPADVEVTTFPYMREGRDYVAPLIRFDRDRAWIVQACSAPIPVEDGKVVGEADPSPGHQPLRNRLAGKSADSFAGRMEEADVPPRVRRHLHLRPQERARRVNGG